MNCFVSGFIILGIIFLFLCFVVFIVNYVDDLKFKKQKEREDYFIEKK